ncbi:MAG: MarR family transcriptional regulator [Candidatus Nanopelagicales bacterium]
MQQATDVRAAPQGLLESLYEVVGHIRRLSPSDALDPSGIFVLEMLRRCGAARPSDMATRTGLDQSTISRKIRALESQGCIERTADPGDGRASVVTVTPTGHDLLRQSLDTRAATLSDALESWTDVDRHNLGALLRRLADDLDTEAAHGSHPTCPHPATDKDAS